MIKTLKPRYLMIAGGFGNRSGSQTARCHRDGPQLAGCRDAPCAEQASARERASTNKEDDSFMIGE